MLLHKTRADLSCWIEALSQKLVKRHQADLALVVRESTVELRVVIRGIAMSSRPPTPLPKRACTRNVAVHQAGMHSSRTRIVDKHMRAHVRQDPTD